MKFLAAYIMKGRMSSIMVASSLGLLSLLLPPVSIVSSASVALVTLRKGGYEGLIVLGYASLAAAIIGFFIFGSLQIGVLFGLVLWLPIWLISIVLREAKHLSIAVQVAVLLGVVAVVGFYFFVSEPAVIWRSYLEQIIKPMLESDSVVSTETLNLQLQMLSRYMTGGIIAGSVYGLLFSLFLARWWQSALYNPGGFREEYLSLRVDTKVTIASLVIFAMAWFTSGIISEICWNITIIFVVLFVLVGLAVLHTAFSTIKTKRFMVPILYITVVLIPHVIAIIAVVGLLDGWMDLRKKFSNKTGT